MTKLCARGKSAAKRKFKVYPSAYANAYASKICAGKAKDPSGVKRKDWGPKKAKVGMAVTAGSQSATGRLEKSGMKMMSGGFGIFSKKKKKEEKSQQVKNTKKKKNRLEELKKEISNMNTGGEMKIKKVVKGLEKASKLHANQAKTLKTIKVRGGGMAIKGTNFKGVF
mgnify:CR=1 FL=1|jgi:hypothetical protein|tara:strand:+ start:509 stop:1012 length:504 start_codon:yes stop_codon:yes gene_type:complete